jgi:hypothetical protein
MLARSRYDRLQECALLLSSMTRTDRDKNMLAFYEWISPITGQGRGAFPFRTGISSVRIALTDILSRAEQRNAPPVTERRNAKHGMAIAS